MSVCMYIIFINYTDMPFCMPKLTLKDATKLVNLWHKTVFYLSLLKNFFYKLTFSYTTSPSPSKFVTFFNLLLIFFPTPLPFLILILISCKPLIIKFHDDTFHCYVKNKSKRSISEDKSNNHLKTNFQFL